MGYERLELEAYPDPGSKDGKPWTAGWGHTGPEVVPGLRITKEQADRWLESDLEVAGRAIERLILPGLSEVEFAALVSWVFNVGQENARTSTLRRRINAGEPVAKVLAEELPRWNKGEGDEPMEGLVIRRDAEVAVALGLPISRATGRIEAVAASQAAQEAPAAAAAPNPSPAPSPVVLEALAAKAARGGDDLIELLDFFRFFNGEPQQVEGVRMLAEALQAPHSRHLLRPGSSWVAKFRQRPPAPAAPPPKAPPKPAAPSALPAKFLHANARYEFQLDSATDQASRMCFSSANAMLLDLVKPDAIKGVKQEDDAYLAMVRKFGDSTTPEAQIAALASYGVKARIRYDGSPGLLKALIMAKRGGPIGILHHGPASNPTGFGHWLKVVGWDDSTGEWICHDPYGELDNVNGGYASNAPTAGRFVRYSYANLNRRWMVRGTGGWLIEVLS